MSFRFIRPSQGMSLLEVLLALSIFAFMFVFISQMVKQNYRQADKLNRDIRSRNSWSHSLSMIKHDFRSLSYFLDINENLALSFPEESPDEETGGIKNSLQDQNEPPSSRDKTDGLKKGKTHPLLFSPYFVFQGEDREMLFVSYTYSALAPEPSMPQWLKIRYHVEDCPNNQGLCLIRSAVPYWDPLDSDEEWKESLVLLQDLQSIEFSYTESEGLLQDEWDKQWRVEQSLTQKDSAFNYPYKTPFPSAIRIEINTQKSGEEVFLFPVSSPLLKVWNPFEKAYNFPVWTPPTSGSSASKKSKKQQPAQRKAPSSGPDELSLPQLRELRQPRE